MRQLPEGGYGLAYILGTQRIGQRLGTELADYVLSNFLLPVLGTDGSRE